MSNRALIFAIALCTIVCVAVLLLSLFPVFPRGKSYEHFEGFNPVPNDKPVVSTLNGYYHLIGSGWTMIEMDGEMYKLLVTDLNLSERRQLASMLRIP